MPETADPDLQLRLAEDGQLEIMEPSHRDGSMRVTGRGVCPSPAHVFGLAAWDSRVFVGTVAGSATAVVMELSDGTSQQCRLRRVEGAEAQYFIVRLPAGLQPVAAVAETDDGERLAQQRFGHFF
ncbi:MAG: hypothetical protein JJE52_03315 [Acidimicrobiia bacterium]|nr:hypothetical protein [Acidimicrobiia bacterium]